MSVERKPLSRTIIIKGEALCALEQSAQRHQGSYGKALAEAIALHKVISDAKTQGARTFIINPHGERVGEIVIGHNRF